MCVCLSDMRAGVLSLTLGTHFSISSRSACSARRGHDGSWSLCRRQGSDVMHQPGRVAQTMLHRALELTLTGAICVLCAGCDRERDVVQKSWLGWRKAVDGWPGNRTPWCGALRWHARERERAPAQVGPTEPSWGLVGSCAAPKLGQMCRRGGAPTSSRLSRRRSQTRVRQRKVNLTATLNTPSSIKEVRMFRFTPAKTLTPRSPSRHTQPIADHLLSAAVSQPLPAPPASDQTGHGDAAVSLQRRRHARP